MGTRGLTAVVLDGEFKVAQYGQWDHYLTGQGNTISNFLRNELDLDRFKAAIRECRFVDQAYIHSKWVECGADDSGWVNMKISKKMNELHPQFSQDTAAEILSLIQDKGVRELDNNLSFAGDSLFCEWAYVVNLDTQELEVYQGFNKEPLDEDERFFDMEELEESTNSDYQPVKLFATVAFSELTETTMQELETRADNEAEEEDEYPEVT